MNIQDQYSRNCDKPPPRGGGGRECETIVTPSFQKCGSGPIIHGSGFGFNADPDPLYTDPDSDSKKSLIYSPHWSCNHINSIAFIEKKVKIEFAHGYLIYA